MTEVTDNPARSRYEITVGGAVAFVEYARRGSDTIELIHTEVPEALAGQGIGSRLAKSVLEDVRRRKLHALASCTFIASYIDRHPGYKDLLQ